MMCGFVQPNPSSLPRFFKPSFSGVVFCVPMGGRLGSVVISNPNVIMNTPITPSVRLTRRNLDHHIYNNNGTWWIHYTVHLADFTKRRIRSSLGTKDPVQARQRRDHALSQLLGMEERGIAA